MNVKKLVLFVVICSLIFPAVGAAQEAGDSADHWWNDRVFYEIFVRSFYDSDGDGIGDLQGLIQKLDYLNDGDPATTDDLGITGIWLMPINPSPSYHGYDVTDYRGINPDYGTMEDFRQLLEEAHARGIAVIIDLVMNHSSSQHPWFLAALAGEEPYADWYVIEDENPGYRGPEGQVVWHARAGKYFYGVFWSEMPDLNYENPDVTAEMYDISRYWLEDVGVDGFRLDAIKFMIGTDTAQQNSRETINWLADYHDYVESVKPGALLLGEVWSSTALAAGYVDEQVDLVFEFDLAQALVRSASFGIAGSAIDAINTVINNYPAGQWATFLTNHDQNRVMNTLRGDVGKAKVAAGFLLTLPGVPFLYYGEEIGMVGVKPDEDIRTAMQWDDTVHAGFTSGDPWRTVNEDYPQKNVAAQADDSESLLSHYNALIHARNSSPALLRGDLTMVEASNGRMVAYLRTYEDETVLVIINMDDQPMTDYSLTVAESALSGVGEVLSLLLGEGEITAPELDASGGFSEYKPMETLPAYSTTIIRWESTAAD